MTSQGIGVDCNVPEIMRIVSCSWISINLVCEDLDHTGTQYSAESNRAPEPMFLALQLRRPDDDPANRLRRLFCVATLAVVFC